MTKPRILLVDDNDDIRSVFQEGLEAHGFAVMPAATVIEALRFISTETFDVLLSDLHMPDAGDGLTVVSAMRHAHPKAVTIVLSGYPALQEAMSAILLEVDEVLAKPVGLAAISEIIQRKIANPAPRKATTKQRVAAILDRDKELTIQNWLSDVDKDRELAGIALSDRDRAGHLPLLLGDLVSRLRLAPKDIVPISSAARDHGILRHKQGYSVAMIVEESRILQVNIFKTLQTNLSIVDFSTVLLDVMTIADEVDSQLKQAMLGYAQPVAEKAFRLPA